jgi:hypothetical protein
MVSRWPGEWSRHKIMLLTFATRIETQENPMSKVIFDISMSLDGFITAANRWPEEPMGDGGERLHAWAFKGDARDREVLEAGVTSSAADRIPIPATP